MTGVVPVVPRIRFTHSLTGEPVAFGTVTVYAAGTTTRAQTFEDRALTIANDDPVELDANGEALFWVDSGGTYKFLLKDAQGNTIPGWPVDNIPGAADVSAAASEAAAAVQPYAAAAQAAKVAAEAAEAQAEIYAATSATAAKFYDTIALGRAGVADTQTFGVKAGGSDGLTRATVYRRDSSSTQTLLFSFVPGSEYDALFPATAPSGYVYTILDAYGKAAWGIQSDGTVRMAYASADTMTATNQLVGTDSVKGEAPYGYAWALTDAYGKALLAWKTGGALEIPDLSATRINGVPAYLVARRRKTVGSGNYYADICGVFSYGQSLSRKAVDTSIMTPTQPYNALMFNAGIQPTDAGGTVASQHTSLVPLVEAVNLNGSESPCGQFAFMTMRLIDEENGLTTSDHTFQLLMAADGIANTPITTLKTVAASNLEFDVTYGASLAAAAGKTYNVPAVLWTQGTYDIGVGTSQASYYADMNTLYANINTMVKAATGQTNDIKLICSMPFIDPASANGGLTDGTNVGLAMMQAVHGNANIIMACPEYPFDHMPPPNVHLIGIGAGMLGAKYGEVFKRVAIDGETWTALGDDSYITVSRQGTLLTVAFSNVFRGPLKLDTTLRTAITNMGFIVKSSGGSARTINSVAIAGANLVKLSVTGLTAGDTVEYGFTTNGGNLRDSEGDDLVLEGRAKRPMHNWCIGFKKTIT